MKKKELLKRQIIMEEELLRIILNKSPKETDIEQDSIFESDKTESLNYRKQYLDDAEARDRRISLEKRRSGLLQSIFEEKVNYSKQVEVQRLRKKVEKLNKKIVNSMDTIEDIQAELEIEKKRREQQEEELLQMKQVLGCVVWMLGISKQKNSVKKMLKDCKKVAKRHNRNFVAKPVITVDYKEI